MPSASGAAAIESSVRSAWRAFQAATCGLSFESEGKVSGVV